MHTVPTIRIVHGDASWTIPVAIIVLLIVAVLWLLQRARDARDKQARQDAAAQGHDVGAFQPDHQAYSATSVTPTPAPQPTPANETASDPRAAAWGDLFVPTTPATRLAEIAASYPEFAAQIAAHPRAYPDLIAWARASAGET